jgi:hypothetical protein
MGESDRPAAYSFCRWCSAVDVQPPSTKAEFSRANRRETNRRFVLIVVLPLVLVLSLCVILPAVLAALQPDQGVASRSTFAQIATVMLISPMCLLAVVQLVLLGGLSYGVIKLSSVLPPAFFKVHQVLRRVQERAEQASNAAARPLIAGHAGAARAGRFVNALRRGPGGGKPRMP